MAAIQIVRFKLAPNTDTQAFAALNERFQREVAPTLAGLERREATIDADGGWTLVLRYTDVDSAKKAGRSDTSDLSKQYMSMIDMSTMSASFHEVVSEG